MSRRIRLRTQRVYEVTDTDTNEVVLTVTDPELARCAAGLGPGLTNTIHVNRDSDGDWIIVSTTELSDAQAAIITWRANPDQVVLGGHVAVHDPAGCRIGHVAAATYHEPPFGPGYVTCSLILR